MAEQQRKPDLRPVEGHWTISKVSDGHSVMEWIEGPDTDEIEVVSAKQAEAALEKEIKVCDDTDEYAKGLEAALREIDDWLHDHGYVDDDDPVRRIIRTALGDIEKTSSVAELRDNYLKRGIDTKPYESTFSEKRIE
jgi:hypothetical protein